MRSPSGPFTWLLRKEWRELMASRSWWVMLLLIGPLVGMAFISAVRTYGELSGVNGTVAGVGEAFSPLIGIWAPTFSACELAAAFLLPFVTIRLVSGDRQSGALKLELQHPMPAMARMSAKAIVLLAAWIIASLPPLLGIVLWRLYGGTTYAPELTAVFAGHVLNAGLTVALACATAAVTDHLSTVHARSKHVARAEADRGTRRISRRISTASSRSNMSLAASQGPAGTALHRIRTCSRRTTRSFVLPCRARGPLGQDRQHQLFQRLRDRFEVTTRYSPCAKLHFCSSVFLHRLPPSRKRRRLAEALAEAGGHSRPTTRGSSCWSPIRAAQS